MSDEQTQREEIISMTVTERRNIFHCTKPSGGKNRRIQDFFFFLGKNVGEET